MSQEDLELFQQMMGDVKTITHDTVELKKAHQVTEAQLAKREAAVSLADHDPEALSIDHAPCLSLMICSNLSGMAFKMAYIASSDWVSTLFKHA